MKAYYRNSVSVGSVDAVKYVYSNAYIHVVELDKTALERKMRLLTLAMLGTQHVGSMIPYSTIASALHIDGKDVEAWVIDGELVTEFYVKSCVLTRLIAGIRANLIGGKLSQPSQTLHVTRATYQLFKPTDWNYLQEKLVGWKTELLGVLDVVANARHAKAATGHKSKAPKSSNVEADRSVSVGA